MDSTPSSISFHFCRPRYLFIALSACSSHIPRAETRHPATLPLSLPVRCTRVPRHPSTSGRRQVNRRGSALSAERSGPETAAGPPASVYSMGTASLNRCGGRPAGHAVRGTVTRRSGYVAWLAGGAGYAGDWS